MSFTFTVLGKPEGARRHRMARRGVGLRAYHCDEHLTAERAVAHAAALAMQKAGWSTTDLPVRLTIEALHLRPASKAKARKWWPTAEEPFRGKPDCDNMAKLIMDACTKAQIWTDDTVVSILEVRRRYVGIDDAGKPTSSERIEVTVEVL